MQTRRSKKSPLIFDPEIDRTFHKNRTLIRSSVMESTVKTSDSPNVSEPTQTPPVNITTTNPTPNSSIPNPPPPPSKQNISNPKETDPVGGSDIPPPLSEYTKLDFNTYPTTMGQGQPSYTYQTQNPYGFNRPGYTEGLVVDDQGVEGEYEEEEYEDDGYEDLGDFGAPQATVVGNPRFQQQPPANIRRQQVVEPRQRVEVNFNNNGRNRLNAGRAIMQPRNVQNAYVPPPYPHRNLDRNRITPVPRRAHQRPVRGIEAHFRPIIVNNPSPIVIPQNREGRTFEIRTTSLQSLPKFSGNATEEPYFHLESYDSICNTIGLQGFSADDVKLVLFQFSLDGKAKRWFHTLPSASIYTWAEMQELFLEEFFTAKMTSDARKEIRNFQQGVDELYHEAFERFNMLLKHCPHHGIDLWELVSSFYQGLTPNDQRDLMSISNGTFGSNYEDIDWGYLDQQANTSKRQTQLHRSSKQTGRARVNEVGMGNRLIDVCGNCNELGHTAEMCPGGDSVDVNYVNNSGGFRGNMNYNTNMYQPGMRNHPNLRYGNASNQANPNFQGNNNSNFAGPSNFSSSAGNNEIMEMLKMIQMEVKNMVDKGEIRDKSVQALTTQVGQLAKEVAEIKKGKGKLPSDTEVNPYHSTTHNVEINQINVVGKDTGRVEGSVGMNMAGVPFPEALLDKNNKGSFYYPGSKVEKGWERVCKIKVNNPIVEKIKQNPENLNPLKNLVENKQKEKKLPKRVPLMSQTSLNAHPNQPIKLQDPGAPLIDIEVGNFAISNVLLDLGAGGNILPGNIYDQHDFGPLHRVDTEVVLPDTSSTKPRGMLKDVIVKVQDFYYPVDFIVVDYKVNVNGYKPNVILGRPFLNTAHARIDCRCGTVDIRFGKETAQLKVLTKITNPLACEYDCDTGFTARMKNLFDGWMKEKTGASPG